MNAHTRNMSGALKRRSIYLARVAQAQMMAGIGLTIAILFGTITLLAAFVNFIIIPSGGINPVAVIFLACVCSITAGGWKLRQREARRARSIPYVPPVREQIAALPADEILVRGSDQPAAGQEELLRPGKYSYDVSSDELLRAERSDSSAAPVQSVYTGNSSR